MNRAVKSMQAAEYPLVVDNVFGEPLGKGYKELKYNHKVVLKHLEIDDGRGFLIDLPPILNSLEVFGVHVEGLGMTHRSLVLF